MAAKGSAVFSAASIAALLYSTPKPKPTGLLSPPCGVSPWSQSKRMRLVPSGLRKLSCVKSTPLSTMPTMVPAPRRPGGPT